MGIFDEGKNLEQDVERLAREHPEQADQAVKEAERLADRETGDRFDSQIQGTGQRAEQLLSGQQQDQSSADGGTNQGG